jgi:hypothetical protein
MLGGITTGTFNTPASAFSASKDIASINLIRGTYLIFWSFVANYSALPTTNYLSITGAPAPVSSNFGGTVITPASQIGFSGSFPVATLTTGTLVLRYNISGGTINTLTLNSYSAVRIA